MHNLNYYLNELHIDTAMRAVLLLLIGVILARVFSLSINKFAKKRLSPHQTMLARRIVFYAIIILFFTSAAEELGFHIKTLLGATGIITIAIGVASQTSISNFVSGLSIIGEKPFELHDIIRVDNLQGEVLSIDFLSVKIRTIENTLIRIPNEVLIKSLVTNLTHFPIKRVSLIIAISYLSNLAHAKHILLTLAEKNPLCLDEPAPTVDVDSYGDSSVNLQFYGWVNTENYLLLKYSLLNAIKPLFDENNIEMPFPCRTLFAGNSSHPLPIQIINPIS